MRVGLIARGEDRGLGNMTWEFFRHVQPDRTLLIDLGELARGFEMHADRYPNATIVNWSGGALPEDEVRAWLEGLDVVYSAETFYDWDVCRWADEIGVATVLHVMPEFYRHHAEPALPRPSAWWAPTSWRLEHLSPETVVVPVPVALDRFEKPAPTNDIVRFLHVIGKRAAVDRNGTNAVVSASRSVRRKMLLRLATQDARLPALQSTRYATIERSSRGTDNYWDLYRHNDVLVIPRRYGGLSLPVQEAMAAGLAVMMPDVSPNRDWPIVPLPTRVGGSLDTQGGKLPLCNVDGRSLATMMDMLVDHRETLDQARTASYRWATAYSWDRLLPVYRAQLEAAVEKRLYTAPHSVVP